jgi:hypothetical protein
MTCSSCCGKSRNVLGASDSLYLLRATAFEMFGLQVDPISCAFHLAVAVICGVRLGAAGEHNGGP